MLKPALARLTSTSTTASPRNLHNRSQVNSFQATIEENRHLDAEYSYMYGNYYDRKAGESAMMQPTVQPRNAPQSEAVAMIEEGEARDFKYGHMYGGYYEKKAIKRARKLYIY